MKRGTPLPLHRMLAFWWRVFTHRAAKPEGKPLRKTVLTRKRDARG